MSDLSVLIVEDLLESRRELRDALVRLGYQVVREISQVTRLQEEIQTVSPEVVLADIRLVDLPEHVETLRQVYQTGAAPVIVMIDHLDHEVALRLNEIGVYAYVMMPVVDEQLRATLDLAIRGYAFRKDRVRKRDLIDAILHTASEGFFVLDGVTKQYLECNDAYCQMLGYTREELLTKTLYDLEVDESPEEIEETGRRVREAGELSFQRRHRAKSGEARVLRARVKPFEGDSGLVYCVFCQDLTETLDREHLIRLQTNALAAAANAVVITDADGNIVWVNRSFSRYTAYTPEEAVGHKPGELLKSGEQDEAFYQDMWQTITRGDVWNSEIINKRKDGTLYTEDMTITPLFDEAGSITHYIAIKQDITKSKELEAMFHRAQRLESIGTLASGVAHDLNNVLSPVMMSAELLAMHETDPKKLQMLQMLKESALRGSEIVRQLLSFARGADASFTSMNVRPLVKEICKVFKETFPKNITIRVEVKRDLWTATGDLTQIHQVLTNLMINARDAMPEGGNLLVSATNEVVGPELTQPYKDAGPGEYIRIQIEDDGVGISEEVRERIFDPFFTTKDLGKGTGLGLSTVLGIVKAHKGFITCDSRPDHGAVFRVYLPRSLEERSGLDQSQSAALPQVGNRERILVVDDEEAIRNMMVGTLDSLNYDVVTARNGKEALQIMAEHVDGFDAVFLDLMMPEMDGTTFLKTVPPDHLGSAHVIVISGLLEQMDLQEIGHQVAYLPKPFAVDEMAKLLRAQLDSARSDDIVGA